MSDFRISQTYSPGLLKENSTETFAGKFLHRGIHNFIVSFLFKRKMNPT